MWSLANRHRDVVNHLQLWVLFAPIMFYDASAFILNTNSIFVSIINIHVGQMSPNNCISLVWHHASSQNDNKLLATSPHLTPRCLSRFTSCWKIDLVADSVNCGEAVGDLWSITGFFLQHWPWLYRRHCAKEASCGGGDKTLWFKSSYWPDLFQQCSLHVCGWWQVLSVWFLTDSFPCYLHWHELT